jgi:hypothetical protein
MAVKVAIDLNVFPMLANATSPVAVDELAIPKSADPLLVGQFRFFSGYPLLSTLDV